MLDFIEKNARHMAEMWAQSIRSSPHSTTYQRLQEAEQIRRARDVYDNLGKWLDRDTTLEQIGEAYQEVGKTRYHEGFPLCEVQYGLHCTKKVLWDNILSEGILTNALEIYQALDLVIHLQNFFDLASFYIIRGYLEELCLKLKQEGVLGRDQWPAFFPPGSFSLEFNPELY